jgi:hypothetical protein
MPDSPIFRECVRERLASLSLDPARELDIEEPAQHLDDRYEELRADGVIDAEASACMAELIYEDALAGRIRSLRQANAPTLVAAGAPTQFFSTVSGKT